MDYLDPPEYDEYLGCPCCGLDEESLEEEEETGKPYCPRCKKNTEWLLENEGEYYCWIPEEPDPEPYDWEIDLVALDQFHQKAEKERLAEEERLKELGLMTKDGKLTSEYYRIADHAYDALKDRR